MIGWFGRKLRKRSAVQPETRRPRPPRVIFTPEAHQHLAVVLERQSEPAALRILVKPSRAGSPQYDMALEPANTVGQADIVLDADGLLVITEARSLAEVEGATIQFSSDPLQPGFTIQAPGFEAPATFDGSDPLAAQVQSVLEQQVNPSIASHGGQAQLVGVKDDVVYLALSGGCQGCSMASVTLKQGIEQTLKQAIPRIRAVIDATDHALGSNPFYSADTAGQTPPHQHAHTHSHA